MTLVIAEAGVNHNGDINIAKELIYEAKDCGADIIKFQTFKTELGISKKTPIVPYQSRNNKTFKTQYELIKELELSYDQFILLKEYSDKIGIEFLSTAFDIQSIRFLNEIGIKRFKIPSGEITNLPYLRAISEYQKPVIISTGMAEMLEIGEALKVFLNKGYSTQNISILHCTTEYPATPDEVNLKAMITILEEFNTQVGYSDHTEGIDIAIAAVALGAKVIEKHLTLNRNFIGPDHQASIEPKQLKAMIDSIRKIEKALGDGIKAPTKSEREIKKLVRKSIVANKNIKKGEQFTVENLIVKRPGTGISPMLWDKVIGKLSNKNYFEDDLIDI